MEQSTEKKPTKTPAKTQANPTEAGKSWIAKTLAAREAAKPVNRLSPLKDDLRNALSAGLTLAEVHAGMRESGIDIPVAAFKDALVELGILEPVKPVPAPVKRPVITKPEPTPPAIEPKPEVKSEVKTEVKTSTFGGMFK